MQSFTTSLLRHCPVVDTAHLKLTVKNKHIKENLNLHPFKPCRIIKCWQDRYFYEGFWSSVKLRITTKTHIFIILFIKQLNYFFTLRHPVNNVAFYRRHFWRNESVLYPHWCNSDLYLLLFNYNWIVKRVWNNRSELLCVCIKWILT